MTSIGYFIENLSYNWSIVTRQDSNINSSKVFCSVKLLSIKKQFIYECCANTLLNIVRHRHSPDFNWRVDIAPHSV